MSFFGFGKNNNENLQQCACGGLCNEQTAVKVEQVQKEGASVKVLGGGCAKCNALEKAATEALTELNMDTCIDHITDFSEIATYGVMSVPALVIDGKVVSMGKVLKKEEVEAILKKIRG